jgi:alpha-amylase
VILKQTGLDQLLQYDAYLRKSLIDHFYEPHVTAQDLAAVQERELGDFVTAPYDPELQRTGGEVRLTLRRAGQADGVPVRITKTIALRGGSDALDVRYVLEDLPRRRPGLHFAVEFNFAGMAAGANDRYFYRDKGTRAGQLQTLQDLHEAERLGLVDEWLGIDVSLHLSQRGGIWAFPIQTVSQSEGGYELVHQSTAVVPHWTIMADEQGRWEVGITLRLATTR